jgi:hypothetical protein
VCTYRFIDGDCVESSSEEGGEGEGEGLGEGLGGAACWVEELREMRFIQGAETTPLLARACSQASWASSIE